MTSAIAQPSKTSFRAAKGDAGALAFRLWEWRDENAAVHDCEFDDSRGRGRGLDLHDALRTAVALLRAAAGARSARVALEAFKERKTSAGITNGSEFIRR